MSDVPVTRPTARVLLLDDQDRALLFLMHSSDGQVFWCPPGGAVEPGESYAAAAVRELHEETGWQEPAIGPIIGTRRHLVAWGEVMYDVRERWFLARVDHLDVDTSGFTEEERADVADHRWWTRAELRATSDRLVPHDFARVVDAILVDGPPRDPWVLDV